MLSQDPFAVISLTWCRWHKTGGNGYVAITLCDGDNNACCGNDGVCCSSPEKLFKLPFFTNLKHPGNLTTSNDESSTPPSQTGNSTSPPKGSTSSDISSTDPPAAATSSDQQATKVGLGVGIPLGILLLATVGYLIWELRKKRKAITTVHEPAAQKYWQYPQQGSFPLAELPNPVVAHQLPAELGRGELDAGYDGAR